MLVSIDWYWNKLESLEIKKGYEYKLYLKNLWYYKKIWKLINWKLVLERKVIHIHWATNSYWFNVKLLESLLSDTLVILKTETEPFPFWMTVNEILQNWFYLHFLDKWFEKQIFYKIPDMKYYTWKI